jgi:hypothetical protein
MYTNVIKHNLQIFPKMFCKLGTVKNQYNLLTMNNLFNKKIGSIRVGTALFIVLIFAIYFLFEALG